MRQFCNFMIYHDCHYMKRLKIANDDTLFVNSLIEASF